MATVPPTPSAAVDAGEPPLKPCSEESHPSGAIKYRGLRQYLRMLLIGVYFNVGIIVIFLTQLIGAPLYLISKPVYYAWMARTKAHFGVLSTSIAQWWSPSIIRVTGDRSVRHQITVTPDGRLECKFPERMILIANHQLYSDWLYLWWIAYTSKLHGYLYVILKESLKWVPILGQGMYFYGFIFLARRWQQDKPRFLHHLSQLNAADHPMWLLIFPEGTNASTNGRCTSRNFAEKIGVKDLKHVLLPRTTGLAFCIKSLRGSTEWVYDCTVAYEGIPEGKFGQDYFTLFSTFFEGRPPRSVNMHFRRFRISDIPADDDPKEFELWLRQRWVEKDDLIEYYVRNGRFPEDEDEHEHVNGITRNGDAAPTIANGNADGSILKKRTVVTSVKNDPKPEPEHEGERKWTGTVETKTRINSIAEVLDIYVVLAIVGLLIHSGMRMWGMASSVAAAAAAG